MMIKEKAYAKINLGLDVLGKRSDGYHEVRMVMQSIDFYDVLEFYEAEGLQLTVDCAKLGNITDNLIYKAAVLLANECNVQPNVQINLQKNIFLAAGLAGGSSDAAATLRGLNKLWNLKLSNSDLEYLSAKLGSDIPFCIQGGTALAEGRGELLTPLNDAPKMDIALVKPKFEVSTAWVYKNFNKELVKTRPNVDNIIKALETQDKQLILSNCGNVLETVTIAKYPLLNEIKNKMLLNGASYALMSGSGPTVFSIAETAVLNKKVLASFEDDGHEGIITTTQRRES